MSAETLKKEFVPKYLAVGQQKFYKFLLLYALNKLILIQKGIYKGTAPDLEFLSYHERFIILYRLEGDLIYRDLSSIFRKAAHKIYRIMLKKNMTNINAKFLNLV